MNRPTPDPSQEGSRQSSVRREFPSWEGLGVGSWSQCMRKSERRLSMNSAPPHPCPPLGGYVSSIGMVWGAHAPSRVVSGAFAGDS